MTRISFGIAPKLTLAATIVALLPALASADEIRVAWYGGSWGDAFQTCIADPFTKATGIKVVPEIGTSNTTIAKLRQQQNNPVIDVAFLDGGISELAEADGLLRPLDDSAIPNLNQLQQSAVYKNAAGETFAASAGYYSLGIAYNKKEIPEPPTSWEALWNDDYAGAVTVPSPANSSGIPFIVFLASIWDTPLSNLDPVYQKLAKLDVSSYFDSSGAASNSFQSGEAIIGAHFNVAAWSLADKGLPIGFAVPKEGVWATDARVHLVKGSPAQANAEKFINQAATPESSQCLAHTLYLGPAVQGVQVDDQVAEKMPWGKDGDISSLNLLDWGEINTQRSAITDAWNRQVARQ
ncbi:ABC transporter substrate-binding protein [Allopusillimonas ginsengisoli]|uniref:ABC transporter substrate-binding protein n=1 Tax=Allopusillimonas ginsengisoli TaxID=453575 RepID=UPI00101F598B|nr:ABC transporter substrate-binding protein [Allopusillimonas ginsengisoli]TEA76841.1 ABC transporter substrate-binding protein [Allopusillimonas ginsengisoli]